MLGVTMTTKPLPAAAGNNPSDRSEGGEDLDLSPPGAEPGVRQALFRNAFQIAGMAGRAFRRERLGPPGTPSDTTDR